MTCRPYSHFRSQPPQPPTPRLPWLLPVASHRFRYRRPLESITETNHDHHIHSYYEQKRKEKKRNEKKKKKEKREKIIITSPLTKKKKKKKTPSPSSSSTRWKNNGRPAGRTVSLYLSRSFKIGGSLYASRASRAGSSPVISSRGRKFSRFFGILRQPCMEKISNFDFIFDHPSRWWRFEGTTSG